MKGKKRSLAVLAILVKDVRQTNSSMYLDKLIYIHQKHSAAGVEKASATSAVRHDPIIVGKREIPAVNIGLLPIMAMRRS